MRVDRPLRQEVRVKANRWWPLKLAFAAGVLAWLLAGADAAAIARLLAGISPPVLLAFLAGQLLAIYIATLKWGVLLHDRRLGVLWRLNLIAQFFSLVVPGQVGAEAIKAYQLGRGQADAERVAASVLLDKATSLIALLVLGAGGAAFTSLALDAGARTVLPGMLAVSVLALFALRSQPVYRFAGALVRSGGRQFAGSARLFGMIESFLVAWRAFLDDLRVMALSFALGLAYQAIYILILALLARELGFTLPVAEWCWIFALVSVAAIAPITLAGVGVREGVFVFLLAAFGIPVEQALALSFAMFFFHLVLGMLGGAVLVMWRREGP